MFSRSVRILLVEDDAAIHQALSLRLSAEGFDVLVASDGPDAVELGISFAPDLLLLDINLPTLDGFEVASALRSELGSIPAVFMTAMRDSHHWGLARDMQNTWFLEKPFTTPFLIHTVHSAAAA